MHERRDMVMISRRQTLFFVIFCAAVLGLVLLAEITAKLKASDYIARSSQIEARTESNNIR